MDQIHLSQKCPDGVGWGGGEGNNANSETVMLGSSQVDTALQHAVCRCILCVKSPCSGTAETIMFTLVFRLGSIGYVLSTCFQLLMEIE